MRAWLSKTHGTTIELTRHFFLRLFDTDLITTPGQLEKLVAGIFAALCSFSMLAPISQFRKYAELPLLVTESRFHTIAEADRMGYLVFPMFVVAFVVVLEWQALFPSGRDHLILMPLPISRIRMFAAKLAALALFVAIFAAAAGLFPTLILPALQESQWSRAPVPQAIAAHAAATICATVFTFCALLALQGLLMNLLGPFYSRISLALHAALLLIMLCALPQILTVVAMYRRSLLPDWFPPLWFLGMEEVMLGSANPRFAALARTGCLATAASIVTAALLYLASYYRQISIQMEAANRLPFPLLESVFRRLLFATRRTTQEFAVTSFILKTLARSPQHKLLLFGYLGIGLAILANSYVLVFWFDPITRSPDAVQDGIISFSLSAPLVLSFFFISGLRVVFSIPATLEANWLFRLLETEPARHQWLHAVENGFYAAAVAPMLIVAAPFAVSALGWKIVPAHLAACALLCMILVEMMLWEWGKVPFVCSYLPGQRNVAVIFVTYWFVFMLFAYTTTEIESWCLREPWRMLIFLGVLLCVFARLRQIRFERRPRSSLLFEDRLIDSFEILRLNSAQ